MNTSSSPSRLGRDGDSIAALASARGPAGVAVIRVSGKDLATLLQPFFQLPSKQPWRWHPRTAVYGEIIDPVNNETIDSGIILYFVGPSSFTGEDVVEIQCHGGPYIVGRILESLAAQGIRRADPGEFSKRAFLNGRIDLTAAEGIKELVEAQSHQQWLAAHQLSSGKLADCISQLREDLVKAMALLEAQIDFPDEGDTAHLALQQVAEAVTDVKDRIANLRNTFENGRIASQGLSVALIGIPNAGKSTMLNTLLGQDRAIVTPIAGTTRDYIEETCLINGRYIRLLDTAGIRDNPDEIEQIGVETARELAKKSDIVLLLSSAENKVPIEAAELFGADHKSMIRVMTKADLAQPEWGSDWLGVSSHTGQGLDELKKRIADIVDRYVSPLEDETFITSTRHRDALDLALAAIARYTEAAEQGEFEECLAFELREAKDALQAIIGEIGTEDVLGKIFSTFCIGK